MKVFELIAALQELDPEREVLLSKDEEGNGYAGIRYIDKCKYRIEGYEIEIGLEELTDELMKQGYGEEDVMEDGIPAIILWP